jgi:7-carboxy-7-deazaguanine synthase
VFGANPPRAQELGDGRTLWVQEVFHTLQGEGPLLGQPSTFIRLAGCNLACFWCDTEFESSTWRPTLDELLAKVDTLTPPTTRLVVLTGGEPFRQNIAPLVEALLAKGLQVQIETAGTLWVDLPDHKNLMIVCSPKTKNLHEKIVPRLAAYKYVVADGDADPADGLPTHSTQKPGQPTRLARPAPGVPVFLSPRDDHDPTRNAANLKFAAALALRHGYRLTLQMHKLIGLD